MRTLVIGDIHGYAVALDAVLAAAAPTAEDVVVTLGDYVDRGPDSRGVLDRLIALNATGRLVPLFGNHDEMMLAALAGDGSYRRMWLSYGGAQTLESYGLTLADAGRVPQEHVAFLRGCLPWHETERFVFAHATVNPLLPMAEQAADDLRWMKLYGPVRHFTGKTLICGHTRQLSGRPWVQPGVVCIDTGVYEPEGWLTCLWAEDGEYWQANGRGEVRGGRLESGGAP